MRVIVAVSGASGVQYGVELLKALNEKKVETHLVLSEWAEKLIGIETDYKISEVKKLAEKCYGNKELDAAIASSSFLVDAMIVIPCSVKTISEIANAHTDTLITRAADNMLKMKKRLVLCLRETPLSAPAIEQMYKVTVAGAIVMPLAPGFYHKPKELKDLYAFISGKAMDCLGIENTEFRRWS
ncbi:MAG: UbiX family flavin prenyltransferase [Candidatus Diapherotrites archaeon]